MESAPKAPSGREIQFGKRERDQDAPFLPTQSSLRGAPQLSVGLVLISRSSSAGLCARLGRSWRTLSSFFAFPMPSARIGT